jgi:8-oxo-dGTP diphosphatase
MITCQFENGNPASLRHVTVDGLIVKDNHILLVHRAPHLLEGGKWGLPGGFMDRDETIFQALAREVKEETGWGVKDLVLLKVDSRPNRPGEDRQNVAFIITGTATEQTSHPDDESDDVRWYALDALPPAPEMAFDHGAALELYLQHRQQPLGVPTLF